MGENWKIQLFALGAIILGAITIAKSNNTAMITFSGMIIAFGVIVFFMESVRQKQQGYV